MKKVAPRAVGEFLLSAVPQLEERLLDQRIRQSWSAIVGDDVARRSRPERIVNGRLDVVVDNSPWLSELTLRSAELHQRIVERFAGVRSLRFQLGTLPAESRPAPPPALRPVQITDGDRQEIDEAVAVIPDPTLAAAARRLMTKARRFPLSRGGQ